MLKKKFDFLVNLLKSILKPIIPIIDGRQLIHFRFW
jgi:hypothetical protein